MELTIISFIFKFNIVTWAILNGSGNAEPVPVRFESLEEYYLKIRKSTPEDEALLRTLEPTDLFLMNRICRRVLGSKFFRIKQEEYFDPWHDLSIRNQIRISHYRGSHYFEPKNKYEKVNVNIGKSYYPEHVFSCWAKQQQTQLIKQYFISRYYGKSHARFLFTYCGNYEGLVLLVLLDDPSHFTRIIVHGEDLMKHYYKSESIPADAINEAPQTGTICGLVEADKLRLCSIIMLTRYMFKGVIEFWPMKFHVDYTCLFRQVTFPKTNNAKSISSNQNYYEWMIGCRGKYDVTGASKNPFIYYISLRSKHDYNKTVDSIYAYKKSKSENFVLDYHVEYEQEWRN